MPGAVGFASGLVGGLEGTKGGALILREVVASGYLFSCFLPHPCPLVDLPHFVTLDYWINLIEVLMYSVHADLS